MQNILLALSISFLFLIASCGGGGGDSTPATISIDIAGVWTITETDKPSNCAVPAPPESFNLTVSQNGSSVTVVDEDNNSFSATLNAYTLSWGGSYSDIAPDGTPGTTTLTSMVSTIDASCNSLTGIANWTWAATDGSGYTCSGTTTFTGSRTPASGCGVTDPTGIPDVPTSLNATTLSASVIGIDWADNSDNEQSFLIERASGSPNGFIQVATVAANVNSFTDMSLTPSTTYYYQVRASNSVGNSAYSNIAQATTSIASTTAPAAPSSLSATALSSNSIQLNWTDVADNEDGYRIERGLSTSNYAQVASIVPGSTSYTDTVGILGSTLYYYRVVAYNTVGSNSAIANIMTPAATTNYTLTVNKAGDGSGTVTATGIDCGSDCTHIASSGTTITLTASPLSGSVFSSWSGCDSSSFTSCTVTMTSNKTVTASFITALTTSVTLSLPTTSTTGAYTLSWTVSGLTSTSWVIEEDSDTSFSSPTNYYLSNASAPYFYSFSNKSNGTYCYRVKGAIPVWSEAKCITVATPTSATLRIINNTKYDMIDLKLNNVQKISYPYGIAPGNSADFVFTSGGSVSVNYGVGFYDYFGFADIWFTGSTTVSLTSGLTYTLTANNPTLGDMLSNFSASRNWDGIYYCYSCSYLVHTARFNFTSSGSWTLYDDGSQIDAGTATLVSWPTYGSVITFKVCPACENIQLPAPFGVFLYRNGPPDWPNIEYVGQ